MIRGILFDKDGTLFDFNESWGVWARQFIDGYTEDDATRRALAQGFMLDYDTKRFDPASPIIAGTSAEMLRAVKSVFPEREDAEIFDALRNSTRAARLAPVCDLSQYLGDLKAKGYLLGIATNDDEEGAKRQLERENALEYFDYIAGYDSGFGSKPDPGMCIGFLRALELQADEAVMVGDSHFDLFAGEGAGMRTIGVLTGAATRAHLAKADVVLDDITKIEGWIQAQNHQG